MQVISEYDVVPANSLVALINDGTHSLGDYNRGTLFIVSAGFLGGSNFTLIEVNSNKMHSGIGRTFSRIARRFRFPYKNEVKRGLKVLK